METRRLDPRRVSGLRLPVREAAGAGRARLPDRQRIRQQRPVQSHLLHRGQSGAVSPVSGEGRDPPPEDSGQLRFLHRGFLWPVPLRHVRSRVSLRAEECRLRRLSCAAVQRQRWHQGGIRRAGAEVHHRFRVRHVECHAPGRCVQRPDLSDPPLRSEQGRNRSCFPRNRGRPVRGPAQPQEL